MKIKYIIFPSIILSIFYWLSNPSFIEHVTLKVEEKVDSTVTVSFSCVGDIMCHSTQYNSAKVGKDSFDFKPVFEFVNEYLTNKDILFGNLETVLAGNSKNYSGYPFFNTPNEFAEALKFAGFDFLFTANNHANDQGIDGIKRTIDELKKVNIVSLGTTIPEDSLESYNLFVRKGLKFGILSYTYGTNYKNSNKNPEKFINIIDTIKIKNDIENLKNKHADLIIIYFHFGNEYSRTVSKYQRKIVDQSIKYGADVILASHPHVIQQFEKFKTNKSNLDSAIVTFSLGNFISNQRWRYSDGGIILNFDITKNIFTDSVYVSNINFLPIWIFKGKINGKKEYRILPSQNFNDSINYNFLTSADIDSMKRSYFDNLKLFLSKNNLPKIDALKFKNE
ncbi:MAG: CapA family protein [Ignavibacteriae bacterium]|nr:CapA family protein [Ignavibacteriota bacterium]